MIPVKTSLRAHRRLKLPESIKSLGWPSQTKYHARTLREAPRLMQSIPGVPQRDWISRRGVPVGVQIEVLVRERYEDPVRSSSVSAHRNK